MVVGNDGAYPDLSQPIRVVSHLGFTPISLTSLQIGNGTLIAAGGQETEIHLSYHTPAASSASSERRSGSCVQWEFEGTLTGSINNSVLLTSLSLTRSNESSIEPRVGISNNDGSVKLYDIPLRVQSARRRLREVGQIRLEVPVNHCESFYTCHYCFDLAEVSAVVAVLYFVQLLFVGCFCATFILDMCNGMNGAGGEPQSFSLTMHQSPFLDRSGAYLQSLLHSHFFYPPNSVHIIGSSIN